MRVWPRSSYWNQTLRESAENCGFSTSRSSVDVSERVVPAGALTVERRDGLVCVQLRAPARVMLTLPVVQLHGTACALDDRLAAGE